VSGREAILQRMRGALAGSGDDSARRKTVETRLARAPKGLIPTRGQLEPKARVALFCDMADKAAATLKRVKGYDQVPAAVADYLRSRNLPAAIRIGSDKRLAAAPWARQRALQLRDGASDGDDEAGVSHAFGGVAETGTLVLHSGSANPTTINFLPEHHIVVLAADDIEGDLESVLKKLNNRKGPRLPRTVNLITGPSRSADIEQTLILGAHGPRALHIIVVG
jgi:L-lactate dehydrogenase complex protein LldG